MSPTSTSAVIVQPTADLNADLSFLTEQLGFKLLEIYPSDDPAVALLTGCGVTIRLDRNSDAAAALIEIHESDLSETQLISSQGSLLAPNGMRVRLRQIPSELQVPATEHKFEVRRLRDSDSWVIGRAGMHYRDLIPDRLGGSIIASHIRIPEGGPVPDMVHYHTIGFQLIYCYRGWVKLVYEDQGPPFILNAGDCVTQPPRIRHRVLEASDNLEVVEIAVPAEHMTTIDHNMTLPNPQIDHDRLFDGQKFCHHLRDQAIWTKHSMSGWICCDTGVHEATNGVAGVQVVRPERSLLQTETTEHYQQDADIYFAFVLEGRAVIDSELGSSKLSAGDAFVLPPGFPVAVLPISEDLELLQVTLPGKLTSRLTSSG